MKIDSSIIDILRHYCTIHSEYLEIETQLDRKQYVTLNKVLSLVGAVWDKKKKIHLFQKEETAQILETIKNGDLETVVDPQKDFNFFPTPDNIIDQMISLSDIRPFHKVLEPSAGKGAIVKRVLPLVNFIVAVEILESNCNCIAKLRQNYDLHNKQFWIYNDDFMDVNYNITFDRILMNPPFSKGNDVKHILHAYQFLAKGGILCSVASKGVTFREQNPYKKLHALNPYIIDLPEKSFSSSGTNVNTCIVMLKK